MSSLNFEEENKILLGDFRRKCKMKMKKVFDWLFDTDKGTAVFIVGSTLLLSTVIIWPLQLHQASDSEEFWALCQGNFDNILCYGSGSVGNGEDSWPFDYVVVDDGTLIFVIDRRIKFPDDADFKPDSRVLNIDIRENGWSYVRSNLTVNDIVSSFGECSEESLDQTLDQLLIGAWGYRE